MPGIVHRGRRRLMEELDDLEARQFAGPARVLDLVMVEVRWHGDDGRVEQVARIIERGGKDIPAMLQDARRHFDSRQLRTTDLEFLVEPDVAFDRGHRRLDRLPELPRRPADHGPILSRMMADDGWKN